MGPHVPLPPHTQTPPQHLWDSVSESSEDESTAPERLRTLSIFKEQAPRSTCASSCGTEDGRQRRFSTPPHQQPDPDCSQLASANANAARLLNEEFAFGGWRAAAALAELALNVDLGPRTLNLEHTSLTTPNTAQLPNQASFLTPPMSMPLARSLAQTLQTRTPPPQGRSRPIQFTGDAALAAAAAMHGCVTADGNHDTAPGDGSRSQRRSNSTYTTPPPATRPSMYVNATALTPSRQEAAVQTVWLREAAVQTADDLEVSQPKTHRSTDSCAHTLPAHASTTGTQPSSAPEQVQSTNHHATQTTQTPVNGPWSGLRTSAKPLTTPSTAGSIITGEPHESSFSSPASGTGQELASDSWWLAVEGSQHRPPHQYVTSPLVQAEPHQGGHVQQLGGRITEQSESWWHSQEPTPRQSIAGASSPPDSPDAATAPSLLVPIITQVPQVVTSSTHPTSPPTCIPSSFNTPASGGPPLAASPAPTATPAPTRLGGWVLPDTVYVTDQQQGSPAISPTQHAPYQSLHTSEADSLACLPATLQGDGVAPSSGTQKPTSNTRGGDALVRPLGRVTDDTLNVMDVVQHAQYMAAEQTAPRHPTMASAASRQEVSVVSSAASALMHVQGGPKATINSAEAAQAHTWIAYPAAPAMPILEPEITPCADLLVSDVDDACLGNSCASASMASVMPSTTGSASNHGSTKGGKQTGSWAKSAGLEAEGRTGGQGRRVMSVMMVVAVLVWAALCVVVAASRSGVYAWQMTHALTHSKPAALLNQLRQPLDSLSTISLHRTLDKYWSIIRAQQALSPNSAKQMNVGVDQPGSEASCGHEQMLPASLIGLDKAIAQGDTQTELQQAFGIDNMHVANDAGHPALYSTMPSTDALLAGTKTASGDSGAVEAASVVADVTGSADCVPALEVEEQPILEDATTLDITGPGTTEAFSSLPDAGAGPVSTPAESSPSIPDADTTMAVHLTGATGEWVSGAIPDAMDVMRLNIHDEQSSSLVDAETITYPPPPEEFLPVLDMAAWLGPGLMDVPPALQDANEQALPPAPAPAGEDSAIEDSTEWVLRKGTATRSGLWTGLRNHAWLLSILSSSAWAQARATACAGENCVDSDQAIAIVVPSCTLIATGICLLLPALFAGRHWMRSRLSDAAARGILQDIPGGGPVDEAGASAAVMREAEAEDAARRELGLPPVCRVLRLKSGVSFGGQATTNADVRQRRDGPVLTQNGAVFSRAALLRAVEEAGGMSDDDDRGDADEVQVDDTELLW